MLISRTPFRFSLIGGGSDLPAYYENHGPAKIISMTLTASMYVTYSQHGFYSDPGAIRDSRIRLSYTKTELVNYIDDIEHELIRAVLARIKDGGFGEIPECFEMTTVSDIPSKGCGLGSSSALIVGILRILLRDYTSINLATLAYDIETKGLGRNIGFQDHISAAIGGLRGYNTLHQDRGISIQHSDPLLSKRGENLATNLIAFRLPVNRSNSTQNIPKHLTLSKMQEDMKGRAPFITDTVLMVPDMWSALRAGNYKEMGRVLGEAWELKKKSHGILDENIDMWYTKAVDAGAFAGKVSGSMSGGAGHLFFLAYPDDHDRIRDALKELVEFRVEYYPHGSTVIEV